MEPTAGSGRRRRRLGHRCLRRRSAYVTVQRSKSCTELEIDARLVNTGLAGWVDAFGCRGGAGCLVIPRPFYSLSTIVLTSVLPALDAATHLSMTYNLVNEVLHPSF